jgi:hypothetical protein
MTDVPYGLHVSRRDRVGTSRRNDPAYRPTT